MSKLVSVILEAFVKAIKQVQCHRQVEYVPPTIVM